MTDPAAPFISELIRAANEAEKLTKRECARLLERAAATLRDCRHQINYFDTLANSGGPKRCPAQVVGNGSANRPLHGRRSCRRTARCSGLDQNGSHAHGSEAGEIRVAEGPLNNRRRRRNEQAPRPPVEALSGPNLPAQSPSTFILSGSKAGLSTRSQSPPSFHGPVMSWAPSPSPVESLKY